MNAVLPIIFLMSALMSIQLGASLTKQLFPVTGVVGAIMLRLLLTSSLLLVFRPWRVKLVGAELVTVICYGGSIGAMTLFFYLAMERIPLGITVTLEFLGPLTVALLSSRKKIDFLWIFLTAAGVALITVFSSDLSKPIDLIGCLFALLGGAFWALYMFFAKKAVASVPPTKLVALGMIVATLVILPIYLIFGDGKELFNRDIVPLAAAIAFLSNVLPFLIEIVVISKLPLSRVGILMSLEPAFAALSGFVILGEALTLLQWSAIACIMLASIGSSGSQEYPIAEA